MLEHFDHLTAAELLIRDLPPSNDAATIERSASLPPLDSLTLKFGAVTALCLKSLEKIVTSWSDIKRLSFQFHRFRRNQLPAGVEIFGADFPFREFALASFGLEELHLGSEYLARRPIVLARGPEITIPRSAWINRASLRNLKALSLECDIKLERGSFSNIVRATPLVEHFQGIQTDEPWLGVAGLDREDLMFISSWRRLRTCVLAIDECNDDLASAIPDWGQNRGATAPQRARREFVRLNDLNFVPSLVEDWKKNLHFLQALDIVCRVSVTKRPESEFIIRPALQLRDCGFIALFPLVYASLCDCGKVHFWTDAKDNSAKCLGFLEPVQ